MSNESNDEVRMTAEEWAQAREAEARLGGPLYAELRERVEELEQRFPRGRIDMLESKLSRVVAELDNVTQQRDKMLALLRSVSSVGWDWDNLKKALGV